MRVLQSMQNFPTYPSQPCVTFVVERWNRTAIAALISAVEDILETGWIRIVSSKDLEDCQLKTDPRVVEVFCFSSMTTTFDLTLAGFEKLKARAQRQARTKFLTICGGAHATGNPASVLESGFDLCCVGEGEEVLRDLVVRLKRGDAISEIDGLLTRIDDQIKGRLRSTYTDIETYPALPTKHLFPTYIEIGRGCRWGCKYCQTPHIHGKLERFRSPQSIERTVADYGKRGMKDFRFVIPNALGYLSQAPKQPNPAAIAELLERCAKAAQGGKIYLGSFPSEIRPDYVTEEAIEILKKYVANKVLVIGAQSADDRVLETIGRGHRVEDIENAVSVVIGCRFRPIVDIILGLPGEDGESRRKTFGLIEKLGSRGAVFNVHFFMPIPGTPFEKEMPNFLTEIERRMLDRYAQMGIVRGRWRRQERIAKRLGGADHAVQA